MNYKAMTRDELAALEYELIRRGNLNAAGEVSDFIKYYGARVRVIKGRKIPAGVEGVVFWVKKYDYSKYGDPWGIYSSTRIGFKTDDGETQFTAADNVEIITTAG